MNLKINKSSCIDAKNAISGLCLAGAILVPGTVMAQPILDLPPYAVIATRADVSLDELSPSVTVISGEEIDTRGYERIEDVLQRIPGLTTVTTGQHGNVVSIFTRGTESNHTAVLLNGRRLNRGFSGQYNLADYGLQGVNQIEVLRGSSSALYGSDAIGGTINLRTLPAQPGTFDSTARFEGGSFKTANAQFSTAYADERMSFNLGTSFFRTDNDPESGADNGFEFRNIVPYLSYNINDVLTANLQLLYTQSKVEVPGARFSAGFPEAEINESETWLISPGFLVQQEDYEIRGFISRTENRFFVTNTAFSDRNFRAITDEAQIQFDYLAIDNTRLTTGLAYQREDFLQIDKTGGGFQNYEDSSNSKAIFIQAEHRFADVWIVRGGARYEDYSAYSDADTYTGEIARLFPDHDLTLFAKASTGYAPPTALDFSFDGVPSNVPDPEKSVSYEVGARKYFDNRRYKVEGSLFYSRINNFIDISDNVTFDTTNIGTVRIQGLELAFEAKVTEEFLVYGNYTYLDAINKDVYRGNIDAHSRLPRRPRHQLVLGGVYQFAQGHLGAEMLGVYSREDLDFNFPVEKIDLEDYTLFRVFGSYGLTDNVSLFGRIENIFDKTYDTTYGYRGHGAGAFVGLRVDL